MIKEDLRIDDTQEDPPDLSTGPATPMVVDTREHPRKRARSGTSGSLVRRADLLCPCCSARYREVGALKQHIPECRARQQERRTGPVAAAVEDTRENRAKIYGVLREDACSLKDNHRMASMNMGLTTPKVGRIARAILARQGSWGTLENPGTVPDHQEHPAATPRVPRLRVSKAPGTQDASKQWYQCSVVPQL